MAIWFVYAISECKAIWLATEWKCKIARPVWINKIYIETNSINGQ